MSETPNLWQWLVARKWWVLGAAALVAAGGGYFLLHSGDDIQYLSAKIEHGDIHDVVEATGTINPVTTVQVGSQVSGTINKLYVDFNSRVHKGDLIATIDPSLFKGAVDQATANLRSAQAQLEKDVANLAYAKSNWQRNEALVAQNAVAQLTADNAKSLYDQAQAQISVDKATIKQNEAAVGVAQTNLAYTTIHSPVDGIVVARNVDVGQTVAASLQAPVIFTIAQDLTKMQVYAATDESDVGRIKLGRKVTFKVDAFPRDTFDGAVSQIRMNATTVQNVVTYNTIVDFANPAMKLFPGMTAFVTIPVSTVENVIKVPNTALRFKPSLPALEIDALYLRYGIHGGSNPGRGEAVVWKLDGSKLEPVLIRTGITDHAYTEVLSTTGASLHEGDDVATAILGAKNGR